MNDIAISIKNVSKYYKLYDSPQQRLKESLSLSGKTYHRKYYATRNMDLEIKKGEILGIVGKNGSGKSTLLKLITGVLVPDEGNITVNGEISALLELGSGFNPEFTGLQNIFFYGTILGFTKQEMQEKLDDILAFADIGDFIHQPLKTYSSGMKSRLGFAVAVNIDPEILILDEVLAVGDVLFQRKCYAKMEEFFKSGKTIIFVSHDGNSVRKICTRAVFLEGGNIILDSDAKTVTAYYEKYLFSKAEEREAILDEIKQLTDNSRPIPSIPESSDQKKKFNNITPQQKAYYLPDFLPESTVHIKNFNVEITQIYIRDSEGNRVNVLMQGEYYTLTHEIAFGMDAANISFAMQFKDNNGVSISGSSLKNHKREIPEVAAGERFKVQWDFRCDLLPNTYFVNIGSSCDLDGERVVLHRIIDATCFKVISEHPDRYWGIVSLGQTPHISSMTMPDN